MRHERVIANIPSLSPDDLRSLAVRYVKLVAGYEAASREMDNYALYDVGESPPLRLTGGTREWCLGYAECYRGGDTVVAIDTTVVWPESRFGDTL